MASFNVNLEPVFSIVDEYTFIAIYARSIVATIRTAKDITISLFVAVPIIILSGILKGEDIGTIPDILFKLLLGFIIEKYAK